MVNYYKTPLRITEAIQSHCHTLENLFTHITTMLADAMKLLI